MAPRPDISDKLVHFTSGANLEEAYCRLCSIVEDRRIFGNDGMIRGGFSCVCFTEAPLTSLQHGLVNPTAYSRYSPFGIIVDKRTLFARGGRPVIYQSDDEYLELPEHLRWRHVRYEPAGDDPIDFTWEREWRVNTDYLEIHPSDAGLLLPDSDWAGRIVDDHDEEHDWRVQEYRLIFDSVLAAQYREDFPWRIFTLS